jgi:hypothetical protein
MFESKYENLLSIPKFIRRMVVSILFSGLILFAALSVGILGYHYLADFGWIDSLLNASMILTGMGPVGQLNTDIAKLFASGYALFSGLIFVTVMAITLAPIMHRVLHIFHLDDLDFSETPRSNPHIKPDIHQDKK